MKKILLLLPLLLGVSLSSYAMDKPKSSEFKDHQNKMWNSVDINKDGKISRTEALAKASEMFDKQDLNHDGFLTKDEIKQSRKEMRNHK